VEGIIDMPQIEFDHKLCGGAGECLSVCKYGVWERLEVDGRIIPYPVNQNYCTACKSCEVICPKKAIKVLP
jgi:2-oxoglutarate ferredoxin oxidoreductase subunit delta